MADKDNIDNPKSGGWQVLPPEPTHPKRMRLPLATAVDVRKEMARLYRQMKAGQIAPSDGTKMAYVLNLLRQAIETGDLETRIASLEKAAGTIK